MQDEAEVKMVEESDRLFNLRLTFPALQKNMNPQVGDICEVGFDISNSEVGYASIQVMPMIFRLVCTNGLRTQKALQILRKRHVGINFFQMQDFFTNIFDKDLSVMVEQMELMGNLQNYRVKNLETVMFNIAKNIGIPKRVPQKAILEIATVRPTRYDVLNAFTATARDLPLHERLIVEEKVSDLLLFKNNAWENFEEAA